METSLERGIQMALVEQIPAEIYVKGRGIPYDFEFHTPSDSALAEAKALRMPAGDVLKAVLLKTGEGFAMAITTASQRVDIPRLRRLTADPDVRLATERELMRAFPDFELGALPPLPGLLEVKAYIDPKVFEHEVVAFADGKRTESMLASPRRLFWGEEVWVGPIARDPFEDLRFEGDSIRL